jgi:FADH2 O2-dependent halogenase
VELRGNLVKVDVVVVGSGFAGSILARILARAGWRVLLVDREHHPRFAIGESTTPLANLALERLSHNYDLLELFGLSNHGRWLRSTPGVERGLKRGFSFYRHLPEEGWSRGLDNANRLLVAASPNNEMADTHWLRSDVDEYLARLAVEDGVELLEGAEVTGARVTSEQVTLQVRTSAEILEVRSAMVVDATGAAGAIARRLGVAWGAPLQTTSSLLFGHFRGVAQLSEVGDETLVDAPYPEDWAAVHHLVEEGWMYLLRFDSGLVSAGILLDPSPTSWESRPRALWRELLDRYPTLQRLFAGSVEERPLEFSGRVQHRLATCSGPRWVASPHTYGFVDPLFSTGIAWSLRGVERLAAVLTDLDPEAPSVISGAAFRRYEKLLARELEQIDRLIATAYRARSRFDVFALHSLLYFALVSFDEATERLKEPPEPWWRGFLGAGQPDRERLLIEAGRRVDRALGQTGSEEYGDWIRAAIEPLDVTGLASRARPNLYPADLNTLVRGAAKLGLTQEQAEAGVAKLRSPGEPGT